MNDEETREKVPAVLDGLGKIVDGVAGAFGPVGGLIGRAVRGILSAAAEVIRDQKADVDEVIARIKTPRKLDMSFRDDVDAAIRKKPTR